MVTSLPTPTARRSAPTADYRALERALRAAVGGDVRFDAGARAAYSTDGSNYRQVPIAVVCPLDVDDAVAAVRVCHEHDVPVLNRGGGTSLGGECCNVAVVLDWTRHVHGVESVDAAAQKAIILPGTPLDDANEVLAGHDLIIGPKPATHSHCTIGGMVGNNSCGATAQWSGTTAQNVSRLEILTYDGLRMWVGPTSPEEYRRIVAEGGRAKASAVGGDRGVILEGEQEQRLSKVREAALATTARTPNGPDAWPGWEDSAVAPERLGDYLRALTALLDEYGYGATSLYGHFGHGCVHCSIPFDLTSVDGIAAYRSFVTRAARLCVEHNGSLSGEHGDGQARGELLSIMYGEDVVHAFEEFKAIFDPGNRMNPSKVVHARPLDHYSLGWLPAVAQVAALAPGVANAVTRIPLAKRLAGVDPQRDVPKFAPARIDRWLRKRRSPKGTRGPVLLFIDSFTTAFSPGVAAAAVGVLEAAGFQVVVPPKTVCCGLTWISTGQLGIAERVLRRTVDVLSPYTRKGFPVVGLEPSCTAVFRSDLREMFGRDQDADRLARQTHTLAELLLDRAPDFRPRLPGGPVPAIVQKHCHHHAILGFDADRQVLERTGVEATEPDSGCCGLAGNFGMTPAHRDVSLACAEQGLLPAVRAAAPGTLVLADGFSCRTQIDDAHTGKRPLHLAEVLNAAVRGDHA